MFKFSNYTNETFKEFLTEIINLHIEEAVKRWNEAIDRQNAFVTAKAIMDGAQMELMTTGKQWVVREIPLSMLYVEDYQRMFSMEKVRKNLANFDINKVDVKLVNYRDGRFWLVDGWHTAILLLMAGYTSIAVKITNGLPKEEEAKLFAYQDMGKTRVDRATKFFALIQAGAEQETKIYDIVKGRGYKISKGTRRGQGGHEFTAVSSVEDLYKAGVLELTFDILRDSGFESQTEAFNNRFLHAFKVLKEYNISARDAMYTTLVTAMKNSGTPASFVELCKNTVDGPGCGRDLKEAYIQAYLRKTLAPVQKPEYKKA